MYYRFWLCAIFLNKNIKFKVVIATTDLNSLLFLFLRYLQDLKFKLIVLMNKLKRSKINRLKSLFYYNNDD